MSPDVHHHWIRQGPTWIVAVGVSVALVIAVLAKNIEMLDILKWLAGTVVLGKAVETIGSKRGDANPTRRLP